MPGFHKKHILIVSRCSQTILSQRIHLARAARDAGWSVAVAGDQTAGDYHDRLLAEGFPFHAVPVSQSSLNAGSLLLLIWRLYRLNRTLRPEIVHAFTIKPTIAGMLAAKLASVPVRIVTVPGLGHIFLSSSAIVRRLAVILLRFALRFAHIIYFYNPTDRDTYIDLGIIPAKKARLVAGSGIDSALFKPEPLLATSRLQLLFVGRILIEKGVPELLEAVKLAKMRGADVDLHLVGDIDANNPSAMEPEKFEAAVRDSGAVWHGHSNAIKDHIAAAHVVVLPSHHEGVPLSLLEAGAMGRTLLATDVAGCNEVVRHGANGYLVPLGDIEALSQAIIKLASDRNLVAKMGAEARRDVEQRFDTKVVNAKVVADYMAIADA